VQLIPAGFHDFVVATRQEISNRRLLNQSCIINAGDEQGNTGQVVHTARGEGIRGGVPVTFTVVSVTEVILNKVQEVTERSFCRALSGFRGVVRLDEIWKRDLQSISML